MEKKFFTWEAFDEPGIFYDCTLLIPISEYQVGTRFPVVQMNYDDGWIDLHIDDKTFFRFELILTIGKQTTKGK